MHIAPVNTPDVEYILVCKIALGPVHAQADFEFLFSKLPLTSVTFSLVYIGYGHDVRKLCCGVLILVVNIALGVCKQVFGLGLDMAMASVSSEGEF